MLSRNVPLKSAPWHATPSTTMAARTARQKAEDPGTNHLNPRTVHMNDMEANSEAMTKAEC